MTVSKVKLYSGFFMRGSSGTTKLSKKCKFIVPSCYIQQSTLSSSVLLCHTSGSVSIPYVAMSNKFMKMIKILYFTICDHFTFSINFLLFLIQKTSRVSDADSERIVVDVPPHLIPPEIAVLSPKSSPKSTKKATVVSIATAGRRRSMSPSLSTSPKTINFDRSRHSPLVTRSPVCSSPDSIGDDGCFVRPTKEINNNHFNKFTSPPPSSPPALTHHQQLHSPIKPKAIKSAAIAIIKVYNLIFYKLDLLQA